MTAPTDRTSVRYRDRQTGEIRTEQIPAEGALRWLYETGPGRLISGLVFGHSALSRLYGWWQNSSLSRRAIGPFAARFRIDPEEAALPPERFSSFNAFFTRRLKEGARPFICRPDILCAPADGKVLVFPRLTETVQFPLKGARIAPNELLASEEAARAYAGGAALVVRLAPPDYHRFHFPDDGRAGPARLIPGQYQSVNPVALASRLDLFHRNRRAVTEIETAHFGRMAYVEVGAFAVASIVQTYTPGPVHRGQEKGYFQFGGSTLVLLFTPGAVRFDADLERDTAAGLEVQVRTGSRIGLSRTTY